MVDMKLRDKEDIIALLQGTAKVYEDLKEEIVAVEPPNYTWLGIVFTGIARYQRQIADYLTETTDARPSTAMAYCLKIGVETLMGSVQALTTIQQENVHKTLRLGISRALCDAQDGLNALYDRFRFAK